MIAHADLRAYVATMRELGILRLTVDGTVIELGPAPRAPLPEVASKKPLMSRAEWEERLLFAAVDGFPTEEEPR